MDDVTKAVLVALADDLKGLLPAYMVPSVFLPLRRMPFGTSMKLDRRQLRLLASELSREHVAALALVSRAWTAPTTSMELRLRDVWAQVLGIAAEEIGKNDSFLQIGGDSITAIQTVTAARKARIAVTVKDIFDDPRLSRVADRAVEAADVDEMVEPQPFSLLMPTEVDSIKSQVRQQCALSNSQVIDDIYPCTSLQEGYMALSAKQIGSYIFQNLCPLPAEVDITRFRCAWERTVALCESLRTRMVLCNGVTFQAVIKEDAAWEPTADRDVRSVMTSCQNASMSYGDKLCRYALFEGADNQQIFILTLHHSIYDARGLQIISHTFSDLFQGKEPQRLPSFAGFIKYAMFRDSRNSSDFWQTQLHGARPTMFPSGEIFNNSPGMPRNVSGFLRKAISLPMSPRTSITKATILRAAWAIVLARKCDIDDVCFGATVSGRFASVAGVDRMTGPAIATVPVRIRLDDRQLVSHFLIEVQNQAFDAIPHEQFGLKKISELGEQARKTCAFSNLLVIHPAQTTTPKDNQSRLINAFEEFDNSMDALVDQARHHYQDRLTSVDTGFITEADTMRGYWTYPLIMNCVVYSDHVELLIVYNMSVLTQMQLHALSDQFGAVIHQLLVQDETQLGKISIASSVMSSEDC